ncbi:hypothetical protein ES707_17160 [subsurface metagenome]
MVSRVRRSYVSSIFILVIFAFLVSVPFVLSVPVLVDLDNSSTFGSAVVFEGGKYYINGDVTLVEKTYINKRLVVNASGITLDGNGATLDGYYQGNAIWILEKRDVVVRDLFITEYGYAIDVYFSTGVILENNTISLCQLKDDNYGVRIFNSNNTYIRENVFEKNSIGIGLMQSGTFDNVISENLFTLNRWGMQVGASGNLIYNNAFVENNGTHVWSYSQYVNDYNVSKTAGVNVIGGPYLGGNYWSGYAGEDLDWDGLGDTELPYNSGGGIYPGIYSPFKQGGDYRPLVEPSGPVGGPEMTVDVNPGTLNLRSKGRWITCYIELSEGYDVGEIDVSSILLNGTVAAEEAPVEVGDYDGDGVEDLMVKFDRGEVVEGLDWDWGVTYSDVLVITLDLNDGTDVEGSDTVKVKSKQVSSGGKKGGESQGGPPSAPPGQNKGQGKPEHPPHPKGKPKKGKGGK